MFVASFSARDPSDPFPIAPGRGKVPGKRARISAVRAGTEPTDEEVAMARYGKKASEKVEKAMLERKRGTLRSGRSGKKVTSRKQAIAIGLSEARRAGGKVPKKT
jgi:hypothetical protein